MFLFKNILTGKNKNVFLFCAISIAIFLGIAQTFFSTETGKLVLKNSALAAITTLGEVCGGSTEDIGKFVGPIFNTDTCAHCKAVCEIIGDTDTAYLRDSISTICACGQPEQELPPETGLCTDTNGDGVIDDCGGTFYHTGCDGDTGTCVAYDGKGTNTCYSDDECGITEPSCAIDTDCNDDNTCSNDRCVGNDQTYLSVSVIDNLRGYAYFGANTNPAEIAKVRLSDFTRVASLVLPTASLGAAVIDPAGGFMYFATGGSAVQTPSPAKIHKISLDTFSVVSTLTLNEGEENIRSGVIDTAAGFAYFGTNTSQGKILKIRLSDLTRVAALTYTTGEGFFLTGVIDPLDPTDSSSGYMYFGTDDAPGQIVKVRLSTFSKVATLSLLSGENRLQSSVIDRVNNFAYFMLRWDTSAIIRVDLDNFARFGTFILTGVDFVNSAVLDSSGNNLYLGTDESPAKIIKVEMRPFASQLITRTMNTGDNMLETAVIDGSNTYAYFATNTSPAKVLRIRLSDATRNSALDLSPTAGVNVGTCSNTIKIGTHYACQTNFCASVPNTLTACTNQDGCASIGAACGSSGGICPVSECPFDANTRYLDGTFPYFGGTDNDIYKYIFGGETITNPTAEAYTTSSCDNDSRGGVTRGIMHMKATHSKIIDVAIYSNYSSSFRNFVISTLQDSRGWRQAGITFNILPVGCSPSACSSTDLWVWPDGANHAWPGGGTTNSCSSISSEFPHYDKGYYNIGTGGGCIYDFSNCSRWLINHEVGHALGLTDRENKTESGLDKLMNHLTFSGAGSDKEVWPTSGDIQMIIAGSNCGGKACLQ